MHAAVKFLTKDPTFFTSLQNGSITMQKGLIGDCAQLRLIHVIGNE